LDETRPSVQYFARTVLNTVGRGGLNNCPVVLAAAPVLIPAGATVLLLSPLHPQAPPASIAGSADLRRLPVAPTARSARRVRVAPLATPLPQACPRRRSVGACDEPADRRGGQPVFNATALCLCGIDAAEENDRRYRPTSVPLR